MQTLYAVAANSLEAAQPTKTAPEQEATPFLEAHAFTTVIFQLVEISAEKKGR